MEMASLGQRVRFRTPSLWEGRDRGTRERGGCSSFAFSTGTFKPPRPPRLRRPSQREGDVIAAQHVPTYEPGAGQLNG